MKRNTSQAVGMLVAAAALLVWVPTAEAKIPIPINTGNEVFEVGPLPEELQVPDQPELATWKLGYLCDRFGVMGADVWTWNCKLVAYDEEAESYADLPEDVRVELEKEYPMSQAKRGAWNHYGIGVLLAVMVVGMMAKGATS